MQPKLLAEIDNLKIKLDTTPAYVPPPGIAIRLPNPKPMPEQAELQRVLVSENKLVFLREKDFAKAVEEELKNGNSDYTTRRETVKGPDGKVLMKKGSTGQPAPVRFDPQAQPAFRDVHVASCLCADEGGGRGQHNQYCQRLGYSPIAGDCSLWRGQSWTA